MNRASRLWCGLAAGLASAVLLWTLHTQLAPLSPVLQLLAWGGVLRWWRERPARWQPRPSGRSVALAGLLLAAVGAVLQQGRPTALAPLLPLAVGWVMALLALPLRQQRRLARPLALLAIPALPLLLRWGLPEPLLARATAATAALLLQVVGLDALALGPYLALGATGVQVAGACAGGDDIAVLLAFALLLGLSEPPRRRARLALLLVLAPGLAFLFNACRVAVLAVALRQGGWWQQEAFPALHEGAAAWLFALGAVVFLLVFDHWARQRWWPSLNSSSMA